MTDAGPALQTALERYNRLFDNAQYNTIANLMTADLGADRDSSSVSDVLNLLIDACLGLCGSPTHADAPRLLAVFCGQNDVSIPTIDALHHYLLTFVQSPDTRADDFECASKALLKAYGAKDSLNAAGSCANGIHSWQGRIAYELLVAADYLTQAAVQLLIHGSESYIREKLQYGLRRLTGALYEGVRHSDTPAMFNFKGTYFPDEYDRQ
jgi:hypothetical protein